MKDPYYTYGPPELCAWQVENFRSSKNVFWLQTTSKAFARKLSKRQDTRCVDMVGCNHFRRTYEMRGSWRKLKRLIDRYILSTADSILPVNRLQNASQFTRRVTSAGLPIPLGLVIPDKVSTTTKLSADTPVCSTSGRKRAIGKQRCSSLQLGSSMIQSSAYLGTAGSECAGPVRLPPKIVRDSAVSIDTLLTKEEFLTLTEHMGNGTHSLIF